MTNAEQRAGFICIHVAEQGSPVCLVEHSTPLDELDSGWGFCCRADGHKDDELRLPYGSRRMSNPRLACESMNGSSTSVATSTIRASAPGPLSV